MTRWVVGAIGVACGLWGASLALPLFSWSFVTWLLGGPLVHDILLAPLVGGLGLLLHQACPLRWANLIAGGLATSGVLGLIAVPLLWAPDAPVNPGLHDRNYGPGLLAALGAVWLVVLAIALWPALWHQTLGRLARLQDPQTPVPTVADDDKPDATDNVGGS